MKVQTRTAAAVFGGMTVVALTVGFGGVGASPTDAAVAPATHSSSSVVPAPPQSTGAGVHPATLAGCVSGLDC
ncbi:hypothetical protein [Mycobacterium sp. E2733]|uniref:hypothetical protein n=1 Tax=Mycobacterium sp. E2733 TaxID=1834138 RepID=UPI000800EF8C|nr:hypothetical protein [Mycobacterium sp. E2733]OBI00933.1 hypothetical protein A5678_17775 [Mycobacterium sp. E2733]